MLALLFPGQGSQKVGMAKEIYEQNIKAGELLDNSCDILGYDIKNLMFNGPIETLTKTEFAQPAIFISNAMYLEALKAIQGTDGGKTVWDVLSCLMPQKTEGTSPLSDSPAIADTEGTSPLSDSPAIADTEGTSLMSDKLSDSPAIAEFAVAGHSLGEYSALYSAGVFSFESGLKLVNTRAKAMANCKAPGTMAAVVGLTAEELEPYVSKYSPQVVMANLNTPTQTVISGNQEAIENVSKDIKSDTNQTKKVRVLPLNVSGPFHSPFMTEAYEIMKLEIEKTEFNVPNCFVIPNTLAYETKDVNLIKEALKNQITGQVRWVETVKTLERIGVTKVFEVGGTTTLQKMVKAISDKLEIKNF